MPWKIFPSTSMDVLKQDVLNQGKYNRIASKLTENSQHIMNHCIKESARPSYLNKGRVVAKKIWTRKN